MRGRGDEGRGDEGRGGAADVPFITRGWMAESSGHSSSGRTPFMSGVAKHNGFAVINCLWIGPQSGLNRPFVEFVKLFSVFCDCYTFPSLSTTK